MLNRVWSTVRNRKYVGMLTARTSVSVAVGQVLASSGRVRFRAYSARIDVGALLNQVRDGLGAVQDDELFCD